MENHKLISVNIHVEKIYLWRCPKCQNIHDGVDIIQPGSIVICEKCHKKFKAKMVL